MNINTKVESTVDEDVKKQSPLKIILDSVFIHKFPSFGNKIFYALGFLALTSFMMLVVTGVIMAFAGPTWWLTDHLGSFVRSVHDWSVQAFIAILLLHITVVFLTSGFKPPKRIVWVLGATIFCLALIQTEFGYGLRGDFQSQWRAISGADFWNGAYVGHWFNPESFKQIFGTHILLVPALIFSLFFFHYLLEKTYGISKAYRKDVEYETVPANHTIMFVRGGVLVVAILILSYIFPSPFVAPYDIQRVAKADSNLLGQTILQEFTRTSGTATYLDSINPYTYDTREAYVNIPYQQYLDAAGGIDMLEVFSRETPDVNQRMTEEAQQYFSNPNSIPLGNATINPLIVTINTLIGMGKSGLYQAVINQEDPSSNPTRALRFLSDTGVMDIEAARIHMATEEWGMAREENVPTLSGPGSWWFAPIGMLNSTVLSGDENGDRDAAIILGIVMLLFITFPYIPYLNRLPEKLNLARFIWGKGKPRK